MPKASKRNQPAFRCVIYLVILSWIGILLNQNRFLVYALILCMIDIQILLQLYLFYFLRFCLLVNQLGCLKDQSKQNILFREVSSRHL